MAEMPRPAKVVSPPPPPPPPINGTNPCPIAHATCNANPEKSRKWAKIVDDSFGRAPKLGRIRVGISNGANQSHTPNKHACCVGNEYVPPTVLCEEIKRLNLPTCFKEGWAIVGFSVPSLLLRNALI